MPDFFGVCGRAAEDHLWSAELRYPGDWGVEAQMVKHGDLPIRRQLRTRPLAVRWEELRKDLER